MLLHKQTGRILKVSYDSPRIVAMFRGHSAKLQQQHLGKLRQVWNGTDQILTIFFIVE